MTIDEVLERIEKAANECARSYDAEEVLEGVHTEVRMIRADLDLERLRAEGVPATISVRMRAVQESRLVPVTVADACALRRVLNNTDDPGDFTVASAFVEKCEALTRPAL